MIHDERLGGVGETHSRMRDTKGLESMATPESKVPLKSALECNTTRCKVASQWHSNMKLEC